MKSLFFPRWFALLLECCLNSPIVGMVVTISLFETAIGRAGVDREEDERSVCVSVFAHEEKKVTSRGAIDRNVIK